MKKKIFLTLLGLLVVVGAIGGIKFLQIRKMIDQGQAAPVPPEIVTTAEAERSDWERTLTAVGSLAAVQGVTVAAELPGKVVDIAFEAGQRVEAGELLAKQDTATEEAQLESALAQVALSKSNFQRIDQLMARKAVSQSEYDTAKAQLQENQAQAEAIRASIAKKRIRAPFAGRLGIRLIDLGEILKEGSPVVSLQTLDPIFVDFQVPQIQLSDIETGYTVRVTTNNQDIPPLTGKITTINPQVDPVSRNVSVQAMLANREERLRPGMFVTVDVVLPERNEVLAIPATAVLYSPYGASVFVVEPGSGQGGEGKVVRQQFVRLGEQKGDFIAVESGLKVGETVVSTGVFKLRNGQQVVVDNTLSPAFKLNPQPAEG